MGKTYAKRIENEHELGLWAEEQARKISPELRSKYYEAVQPKIFRDEMADLGLTEDSEIKTMESILFRGAATGTLRDISQFDDEKFVEYMDSFYLPRAKYFHEESVGWFKVRMSKADPELYHYLESYNVDWEKVSYEGNQGTRTVYALPTSIGAIVILFDPSKNTFELLND